MLALNAHFSNDALRKGLLTFLGSRVRSYLLQITSWQRKSPLKFLQKPNLTSGDRKNTDHRPLINHCKYQWAQK